MKHLVGWAVFYKDGLNPYALDKVYLDKDKASKRAGKLYYELEYDDVYIEKTWIMVEKED